MVVRTLLAMIALEATVLATGDDVWSGERKLPLTVAAVCMEPKTDTQANLQTFTQYMAEASEQGAKLIVFPEIALQQNPCWGPGEYVPTEDELLYLRETAEPIPGPSTEALADICRQYGISVIFGMTEDGRDGYFYNASVFLGPNGLIGKRRKGFLASTLYGCNEHLYYRRGSGTTPRDSPMGEAGLIVGIEMFSETGTLLAGNGAEFLVNVSAWPGDSSFDRKLYNNLTEKIARDNGLWHIVANQIDGGEHWSSYGHARIVDPNGLIIGDTGAQEGMVVATTDIVIDVAKAADADGDGTVGLSDLSVMATSWLQTDQSADIAPVFLGDGIVNMADLSILGKYWLTETRLRLHFSLDETEGIVVHDTVENRHGTLYGNPIWQPTGGMHEGALLFDGAGDYIETPFATNPSDGPFSLFVWIKTGTPGSTIISQTGTDGVRWLAIDDVGRLITELQGSGRGQVPLPPGTNVADHQWHRVGFVWDHQYRALYVDDIEVSKDTSVQSVGSSEGRLHIGVNKNLSSGSFFSGLIDDVRIYDRAITP